MHWLALAVVVAGTWRPLAPGVETRSVEREGVVLEAIRLDLDAVELDVVLAAELDRRSATARQFAEATGALVAINGGFFDADMRPVGLRMSAGEVIAGVAQENLQAFVVEAGGARVVTGDHLEEHLGSALEVVQCRPRLVVAGRGHRVKPQPTRRSVAGIDADGKVVLLVTASGVVSGRDLGRWLALPEGEGGFGLEEALNLDGGGSAQLYAEGAIDVRGLTPVADAIVVRSASASP